MKLTISKSKNSATFYVQKSIRKSNGSVSSVTIEKLGNLDQVRARANGVDPYQWAQEYVNELNRKEGCSFLQLRISVPAAHLL